MKTATLTAKSTGQPPGLSWSWRCEAHNVVSTREFAFYYDCVLDAKKHGYVVELARPHGASAPAGAGYNLRAKGE